MIEWQPEGEDMKDVRILGIDLGKNSCSVVGLDAAGRVVMRRKGIVALAAGLRGRDGGVLRRAPPRPRVRSNGTSCS